MIDGHYVWDNGVIQPGVNEDGTPNTTIVTQFEINDMQYGWGTSSTQSYAKAIQDNSYVKCRELSLTYMLPKSLTSKFACSRLSIIVLSRSLMLRPPTVPTGSINLRLVVLPPAPAPLVYHCVQPSNV